MADAVSDIVTLGNAFGQMAAGLDSLRRTRVEVSSARVMAQVTKDNYEFLQRFNLRPDDPQYIDYHNWQSAVEEHAATLEGRLGMVSDPSLRAQVETALAPQTSQFLLDVSSQMAAQERRASVGDYQATVADTMASYPTATERLAALKGVREQFGYVEGWMNAQDRATMASAVYSLEGQAAVERISASPMTVAAPKLDAEGKPVVDADGKPVYESREQTMTLRGALGQLASEREAGTLSEQAYQAGVSFVKAKQKAADEQFAPIWKATFEEPASKDLLTDKQYEEARLALDAARGNISDEQYAISLAGMNTLLERQFVDNITEYTNTFVAMNEESGHLTPAQASLAVMNIVNNVGTRGSTARAEEAQQQITRLLGMVDQSRYSATGMAEAYKAQYEWKKLMYQNQQGGITLADLFNDLSAMKSAGLPVSSLISSETDFLTEESRKGKGQISITEGALDRAALLRRASVSMPELGLRDKDITELGAFWKDPSKKVSESTMALSQIVVAAHSLTVKESQQDPGAFSGSDAFYTRFVDNFKEAKKALGFVAPIQKGLLPGSEIKSFAALQGLLDSGSLGRFAGSDVFGMATGLDAIDTTRSQLRTYVTESVIAPLVSAKVLPDLTSGRYSTVEQGGETYWLDGKDVYTVDSRGGQIVVVKTTLPKDASASTDFRGIDSSAWSVIVPPKVEYKPLPAATTPGMGTSPRGAPIAPARSSPSSTSMRP